MRRTEDRDMPPEVAAALVAVDATLAGDPIDPDYADLAELALVLRADRPVPGDPFAAALDERVGGRFARPARPARSRALRLTRSGTSRLQGARGHRVRRGLYGWAAGVAAAIAATAVVIMLIGQGGGSTGTPRPATDLAASGLSSSSAASTAAAFGPAGAPHRGAAANTGAHKAASTGTAASGSAGGSLVLAPAPAAVSSGKRQIVQSAQLQLSTSPGRIDYVAQEVFDVVAAQRGIVESSNVTATGTPDGNAVFQLSVPSANLAQTLNALSSLHGANVVSRTDTTADITGQVGGAGQRLAEVRALRRSLLKQLAAATTPSQVDSIKLKLRDVDASISSDLSTLRGLQRQVAYSRIALTIQAAAVPPPSHGSSFTLGRAVHDAGRVLVVAAGAALIALAVLVPVALLAGLLGWAGLAIRRHRREQVLDVV
ncbi:MAG TPA: DUF4349 domain-containing protein [Solirubrobacteraceae bacterium]|nr:DUF4349 domain-containing protein [Solirubrobacteraceae bacterium]